MALLRVHPVVAVVAVGFALTAGLPSPSAAQAVTQEEALRRAFPDADAVERRTAYLTAAQLARSRELAGRGVEFDSELVTYYVAIEGGAPVGVAYFDAHRVRTLPEVLMFVVGPDHRIRHVLVLRFSEPPEYRPPTGWLARFVGRMLDPELSERRGIDGITGATLTTRAVTGAARRVLALHQTIAPFENTAP
ncbi:MAG: FMN-binding protein [Longimicrobiales bacterium]